ncbi:MAG: DUF3299 domain-containing protein [Maricaulaceae bacterium]|nr:DUF3299 domain-containing protein [Maricaulaceae bacterium]
MHKFFAIIALILLAFPSASFAQNDTVAEVVMWEDLLPEGELERLERLMAQMQYSTLLSHFGDQQSPQIGTFNVVEELNGRRIRMPGFVLPLDLEAGSVREFLLVPYFGACVHVPPPPPNQIVYVRSETPLRVEELWEPVWVEGVMSTERHMNELGDAAYTLALSSFERYRY